MKLVILDFSDGSVNIHEVGETVKDPEELLEDLGYKESNCSYMLADDLKINFYD